MPKAREALFYFTLIVIIGAYTFIFLVFPVCIDDNWFYVDFFRNIFTGEVYDGIWEQIKGFYSFRYHYDNARLANFVAGPFMLLPPWIFKTLTSIAFAIGLILTIKLLGIRKNTPFALILLCFLWTVALPWAHYMFNSVYAANYIWSIALVSGCICFFLKYELNTPWIAFLLGLLTGAWHECNAAFLASGFTVAIIFNRQLISKPRIAMIAGLCLGFLWLYTATSWGIRTDVAGGWKTKYLWAIAYSWSYIAYLGLYLIGLVRKEWRTYSSEPLPIIILFGTAILFIPVMLSGLFHSMFIGDAMACVGIVWLLTRYLKSATRRAWHRLIACVMLAFLCVHLYFVCDATVTIRSERDAIQRIWEKNRNTTRHTEFSKLTFPWEFNRITMRKPVWHLFFPEPIDPAIMKERFNTYIDIVPERLRDFTPDKGRPIDGAPDCRLYKGLIVSACLSDSTIGGVNIEYGWKREFANTTSIAFTADDGNKYVYMMPFRSIISNYLGEPTRLELIR